MRPPKGKQGGRRRLRTLNVSRGARAKKFEQYALRRLPRLIGGRPVHARVAPATVVHDKAIESSSLAQSGNATTVPLEPNLVKSLLGQLQPDAMRSASGQIHQQSPFDDLDRIPELRVAPNKIRWNDLEPRAAYLLARVEGNRTYRELLGLLPGGVGRGLLEQWFNEGLIGHATAGKGAGAPVSGGSNKSEAVHGGDPDRVRVAFVEEDGTVETLWADDLGGHRFRIVNTPFFYYGVSLGDVVYARVREGLSASDPAHGLRHFETVAEKSGNRTLRLVLAKAGVAEFAPVCTVLDRQAWSVLRDLTELGCNCEGFPPYLVAINVPRGIALDLVLGYLDSTGLMWEYGDPRGTSATAVPGPDSGPPGAPGIEG